MPAGKISCPCPAGTRRVWGTHRAREKTHQQLNFNEYNKYTSTGQNFKIPSQLHVRANWGILSAGRQLLVTKQGVPVGHRDSGRASVGGDVNGSMLTCRRRGAATCLCGSLLSALLVYAAAAGEGATHEGHWESDSGRGRKAGIW